jgi:hypothetical protein
VTTRAVVRPLALLALTAAAVLAGAPGAQAAPTGCTLTSSSFAVASSCTGGTGEQRAVAQACSGIFGCTVTQNFAGAWVGAGGTSTISLTAAWFIPGNGSGARIETRG